MNIISAIVRGKCPACRNSAFFQKSNPYNFKALGEYHKNCGACGQRFSLEPGFYFGAAYVSYGLNVALMASSALSVYLLIEEPAPKHYLTAIFGMTIALFPIVFRASRIIWASMFIPYGGEKKQFNKSQ